MRRSVFTLLDHHPQTGETLASVHATALEQARLADRLGFHSLWVAEHHLYTLGTAPNPAVLLAAIAQCTTRIRLGPAVAVLPLHDPVLLAEDYALLDMLSGGRLNMGVGTGSRPMEFTGLGVCFEDRRALFDARLAELRERWTAAAAGRRGPDSLNVAPVQSPLPPIYVATMHEEGAHAIGLAGDSMLTLVSPATADLDEVAGRLAAHARGLEERGHGGGGAEAVTAVFAHAARSEGEARDTGAPALGLLLGALAGAEPPDPTAIYDAMRERGTGLFGSHERVAELMQRYEALGASHLALVTRFGAMEPAAAERSLRSLAA